MSQYLRLFFSFYGRAGRFVYWGGNAGCLATVAVAFFMTDTIVLLSAANPIAEMLEIVCLWLAAILAAASILAFHVRRVHDTELSELWLIPAFAIMGLSGWWIKNSIPLLREELVYGLLVISPALALLAVTLYLIGGIAGTDGPNRYGPDPREEGLEATPRKEVHAKAALSAAE